MVLEGERWAAQADYDLSVAQLLYQQEVYRYCVFFCHLALEKRLKAILVGSTGRRAPHTHRLNNLARQARINLPHDYGGFLRQLSRHSISARYPSPDELGRYDRELAERTLNRTREVHEWLKSMSAS